IVPDVIENEAATASEGDVAYAASPPVERLGMSTVKKLLTIPDGEPPLRGYRCFLALNDRVRDEKGDFFLQPHRTSVVWGGQRALFIFEHHSGRFGVYYDVQAQERRSQKSGGKPFPTCTIVMKNRIFIPVPSDLEGVFVP